MPLKLNVGLSRKVGEANYGSRGASVNVEMELDSALVGEPQKLRERIRQLFGVVRDSLAEELNGHGGHSGNGSQSGVGAANGNGQTNGNGLSHSNGHGSSNPRPATASQVKALHAICKSQRINLDLLVRDRFKLAKPEDLSIKEASQLIDHLKQKE